MCSRLKDLYQRWKNDKSKKKQIILFFVIVAKEGFDCMFDWLLYLELTMYEEGLLFGSYDFLSVFMLAAVVGLVVTGIDIASKIRRLITGISVTKVSLTDLLVLLNLPPARDARSWIKIVEVDDIVKNGEMNTKVTWNESYLRIQNSNTRNVIDKCYRREETGGFHFTQLANCTIVITGTKLHYHFKYIAPSGRYFLGDIQYNVLVTPIDSCKNVSSQLLPDLRYFQANVSQTRSRHHIGLLYDIGNEFKFYSAEDLEDINKIHAFISQNTSCFNRGRVSPHFNTEISVPCSL